jgi:hypothetical protein
MLKVPLREPLYQPAKQSGSPSLGSLGLQSLISPRVLWLGLHLLTSRPVKEVTQEKPRHWNRTPFNHSESGPIWKAGANLNSDRKESKDNRKKKI